MTYIFKSQNGFIRGRFFVGLMWLAIGTAVLYYGTKWGKEYYKVKMGQTCSDRMWLIEDAKNKFKAQFGPSATVTHYSDLLPFIPFTGFPMCPWGGEYEHKLDVNIPVSCPLNGLAEYEPDTPGRNPLRNGYQDLAGKNTGVTFFQFMHEKATWKGTDKDPNAPAKKKKSGLFDN